MDLVTAFYTVVISVIVSFFVSMIIGNSVSIHYLDKLDKDWRKTLDGIVEVLTDKIKHMHD